MREEMFNQIGKKKITWNRDCLEISFISFFFMFFTNLKKGWNSQFNCILWFEIKYWLPFLLLSKRVTHKINVCLTFLDGKLLWVTLLLKIKPSIATYNNNVRSKIFKKIYKLNNRLWNTLKLRLIKIFTLEVSFTLKV